MENRIVLGFPYAGAFLWLLSAERHYKESIKSNYKGSHPYYITMYGSKHNLIVDETVSLTLLFDEIYLAPVDAFLPDRDRYANGNNYINEDLGVYMNWDWDKDVNMLYNQIEFILKDFEISYILRKVPFSARRQIIQEALNQINISNKFDTAIFAVPSYLQLCQRINALLNPELSALKTQSSKLPLSAVNQIFDIASLNFTIEGLEEFAILRKAPTVRQYGRTFRHYIQELPNGTVDKSVLYDAMLQAINTDETSSKISGGFGMTSTATSLISLIPFVGTIGGLIGLGADLSSRIAHEASNKNKWWLMAPEIAKLLSKKRIETLQKNETRK